MEGIELKQGETEKHNGPVLVPEYPWEAIHTFIGGSVLKKGPLYRMWYQSYVDGLGFFVNYARSADGITWEKPLLKRSCIKAPELYPCVAVNGKVKDFYLSKARVDSCRTNIVGRYHLPSVIYDPDDKDAPYKMFGYTDNGFCVSFSKDGIVFKEYEKNPVIPIMTFPNSHTKKTWFSDVSPVFKDVSKNKFAAFVKTYIIDDEARSRRCVGFSESCDFKTWSEPETIWAPNSDDDKLALAKGFKWADFYGLCGFNYGDGYLGLLWLFYIDYEIKKGTHEGKREVYLAQSSSGKDWKRVSDKPFIPLSEDGWDTGSLCTANVPVFQKDKALIYYGGTNFGHGAGHEETPFDFDHHRVCIGVASVRKDGFVYAYSSSGGHFLTEPVNMKRGVLILNVDTGDGKVTVEVMKVNGSPVCFDIKKVNSIDYRLDTAIKGSVALKVYLHNARLYSVEAL